MNNLQYFTSKIEIFLHDFLHENHYHKFIVMCFFFNDNALRWGQKPPCTLPFMIDWIDWIYFIRINISQYIWLEKDNQ